MNKHEAVSFVQQVNVLASIMSEPQWGDMNVPDAKSIGIAQWRSAIAVAGLVSKECEDAGWPVPGADPDGFIWLTWSNTLQTRQVQLAIHDGAHRMPYVWSQLRHGTKTEHESRSVRDLLESLRTTFASVT